MSGSSVKSTEASLKRAVQSAPADATGAGTSEDAPAEHRGAMEEPYRSIFESALDALFLSDRDALIVEANPAACRLFGYPYEEFVGLSTTALVHPDDLYIWSEALGAISVGSDYQGRARCLRRDGSVIHVEGVAAPFVFKGETHFLSVVRDVTERVRAEEQLREKEAQYRSIFEATTDGLSVVDIEGYIVEVNPAYCQMFGYSRDEVIGLQAAVLIHPDHHHVIAEALQATRQGSAVHTELTMVRKDGALLHADGRATAFTYKGKPHILGVVRDVTEQVHAEERLREQAEQYRSVLEAAGDGLVVYTMGGLIVEANPAFCAMNGYTHEELIGQSVTIVIHPDSHGLFREFVRTVGSGGSLYARATNVRKDGTSFPVDVHGTILLYNGEPHILEVARDVTDQVRAEEELREQELRYRSIFESTSDGVLINDLNGYVVEVNPAACRMHGYLPEEFVGLHRSAYIHPDCHHLIPAYLAGIREHGACTVRSTNVRKDGRAFPVEVHGSSFVYKGQPHVLGVLRDVTEQVRAYELLEQRVEERTRELSTVLNVSHSVASILELEPLLDVILDQLMIVTEYQGAALYRLEEDRLVVLARRTPGPGASTGPANVSILRLGAVWQALCQGETIIIDDISDVEPMPHIYHAAIAECPEITFPGDRAWIAVPLVSQERTLGVITLSHHQPGWYTQHHARLTRAIANQAAIAIENARLYEKAQEIAALEERQRLARELHDSVSQALFGIGLGARTARALLERDGEKAAQSIDYVLSLAQSGMAEMRALIFELRPESLETEGLVQALTKQLEALSARFEIPVSSTLCGEPAVSLPVKAALYRIAQEALHNTVKHAQPRSVEVSLEQEEGEVVLEILDDGEGFDTQGSFPGHLGLHSMRERAQRVGGTLEIESRIGEGTRVRVRIPDRSEHG